MSIFGYLWNRLIDYGAVCLIADGGITALRSLDESSETEKFDRARIRFSQGVRTESISYNSPLDIVLSFPVEISTALSLGLATFMSTWRKIIDVKLHRTLAHAQMQMVNILVEELATAHFDGGREIAVRRKIVRTAELLTVISNIEIVHDEDPEPNGAVTLANDETQDE